MNIFILKGIHHLKVFYPTNDYLLRWRFTVAESGCRIQIVLYPEVS